MKHALFTAKEKDHRKKNIPEILFSVAFLFRRKKKKKPVTENQPTIFMYENLSQHDAVKFLLYIHLRHFVSKINFVTSSFFCYFRISAWGWGPGTLRIYQRQFSTHLRIIKNNKIPPGHCRFDFFIFLRGNSWFPQSRQNLQPSDQFAKNDILFLTQTL